MARWILSPVIGDGTSENPYRLKVADYGIDGSTARYAALIPSRADGTPRFLWGLALWEGDLTLAEQDEDVLVLPDLSSGDVITAEMIPISRGTIPKPRLEAGLTLLQNVELIGQELDPSFTFDRIKVG